MIRLVCFFTILVYASSVTDEEWADYQTKHSKVYSSPTESETRRKIFEENVQKINQHNLEHEQGKHSYSMGINQFTDMTEDEIKATYSMKLPGDGPKGRVLYKPSKCTQIKTDSTDWRGFGCFGPVKSQGNCQSCWSFSTASALACHYKKQMGKSNLVTLSEQYLVDCAKGIQGANAVKCTVGFWPNDAMEFIINKEGIFNDSIYPYRSYDGSVYVCNHYTFPPNIPAATMVSTAYIQTDDDNSLWCALKNIGPVIVTVPIDGTFGAYNGGIYKRNNCEKHKPDHAVLAVGFGYDSTTREPYWIIRNSWGTTWGEQGYGRISAVETNMCGISSSASFPIITNQQLQSPDFK